MNRNQAMNRSSGEKKKFHYEVLKLLVSEQTRIEHGQ